MLAEEYERKFRCLGENTESYITFSIPIQKDIVNETTVIKFIDGERFIATSLSSHADDLAEGHHKSKCIHKTSSL